MDIRKLQRVIVDGLEDVKAQNIVVFNTEHLSALFERVIIASGTSNRQTKSLASSVREAVKDAGFPVPRTEGGTNGEWIIVDCGAAVVHVMQPTIRDYYHLEEIWGDKPVHMKIDNSTPRLVKASEPDKPKRAASAKKVATKTPARKSATASSAKAGAPAPAKAPARKKAAVVMPSAVPAKKATAARKSASSTSPASAPVTRVVGEKKPAVKKTAASTARIVTRVVGLKKPAVKKTAAPASRTVTRVVGVKKTSAKQAPVPSVPARRAPAKKAAPRT